MFYYVYSVYANEFEIGISDQLDLSTAQYRVHYVSLKKEQCADWIESHK